MASKTDRVGAMLKDPWLLVQDLTKALSESTAALATERIKRLDAEESRKSLARVIRETLQARGLFTGDIEQTQSDVVMWVAKALDAERAAREEAEQLAVWAVRHGAFIDDEIPDEEAVIGYWEPNYFHGEPEPDICDSTDAGILAALRRAMEGTT